MSRTVVLLGPQRTGIRVGDVLGRIAPEGPVATINAGWQERESEDVELHEIVGKRSVNLRLYARMEAALEEDPELGEAHRVMQDDLKELRRLYDDRLEHAMAAWIELMPRNGSRFVAAEREDAAEVVRSLDARHLASVRERRREFGKALRPHRRPSVKRHRKEIAGILGGSSAVAVAGGHVAVLLNRLRMFGVVELLGRLPVVAWSAGAMALSRKVVLFHDRPPQGPGNAEAFEEGLGLFPGTLPLPHGSRRLMTGDPDRVRRFVRRFGDDLACILFDPGVEATWSGKGWSSARAVRLTAEGNTMEVREW